MKKLPKRKKSKSLNILLKIIPVLLILFVLLGVYFIIKPKANDDIYSLGNKGNAIFENINPNFTVQFGVKDKPDTQWVRFEAKPTTENPFEEDSSTFLQKIADKVLPKSTYGIEMSLKGVQLSQTEQLEEVDEDVLTVAELLGTDEIKTSVELVESGRIIGENNQEPVAKKAVLNKSVVEGVDIEYQILEGIGLKEEIVIRSLEEYTKECEGNISECKLPLNEFIFDLKIDEGLEIKYGWFTYKGKSTKGYYFTDNKGRYVAHFLHNWAIDQSGNKTYDVDFEVLEKEDNHYEAKVTVDINWLFSPERVYPVRIDPSIVHDTKTEFDMGTNYNTEVVDGPKVQIKDNRIPITDANTSGIWSFDDTSATGFTYYDYDTFESPYPGGNDDWTERNSVDPVISSATAYSGQYSLYMPSGWGRNFEGTTGETGQTSGAGYDTNTYPYMCMAYKIPSGTDVNMLIYILNVGWRSISMTQPEDQLTSYAKVATWRPMVADNNWQYKCINLDNLLDVSLGTGTHTITAVIWHNGGGTYNTGPFYIDDFLIANMPPTKSVKDAGSTDAYIMGNSSLSAGTTEKGMYFDGVDDYVEIPSNFGLTNANVTLEAWVYLDSLSLSGPIIKVGSTGQSGYGIGVGGTYWDANTRGNNLILLFEMVRWVNTGVPVGLGWHHVAMVLNSSGHPSAYLDGKLVYSDTGSVAISPTLNATIIGGYGTARYLNATIDDVRISNTARSEEAIMGSYIAGASEHTGTHISSEIELDSNSFLDDITWDTYGDATNEEEPFSTTGLVAQWNFNEKSGTTAAVSGGTCGSSCNGTLTNITTTGQDVSISSGWTYNGRKAGDGALVFDGTDDRVVINSHSSLGLTTGLTIEAWVKPYSYSTGGYNHILDKHGTYGLSIYNGKPSLYMTAGGWWHPEIEPLELNKWSHVVAQYNGINKTIYVNGIQVAQALQSGSISVTSNAVGIGATSAGPYYFNGVIDTTRVYSRAITTSEILSHYKIGNIDLRYRTSLDGTTWSEWNGGSEKKIDSMDGNLYGTDDYGLVSYYPLNETSGTTLTDIKSGNDGTATNAIITEAKHGNGRNFNGSDRSLTMPHTNLSQGTISFWVFIPASQSWASRFDIVSGSSSSGNGRFLLYRTSTTELTFYQVYDGTIYTIPLSSANTKMVNTWSHVALVYQSSDYGGQMSLYLNGILQGSVLVEKPYTYSNSNVYFMSDRGVQYYAAGIIDEIQIHERPLSENEIKRKWLQGATAHNVIKTNEVPLSVDGNSSLEITSGRKIFERSTAAMWSFDETSGTGAYIKDLSVYGNHGTPVGTTYTEGRYGGARSFNGSSDRILVGNNVNPSLPVTASMWLKLDSVQLAGVFSTGRCTTSAVNYTGVWMHTSDTNQIAIGFGNNAGCGPNGRASFTTTNSVPTGQWLHVVTVMNSYNNMQVYVNGVSYSGVYSGTGTTLVNSASHAGCIGALTDCAGAWIAPLDGEIDDLAIVNRAYTASEVAELYNAGKNRNVSREIESDAKEGILMTRYPGYAGHPTNLTEMLADFQLTPVYTKEIVESAVHRDFGDYYNTMYSTEMEALVSGTWQFAVDGDDAVIVAVGGTTVAGKYGGGGACNCFTYAGSISLTAGTKYTVNMWHEEDAGGDSAQLWYKDPNDTVWKHFSVSNTAGSAKLRAYELPDDQVNTLEYITNGMPSLSELEKPTALPFWIASDRLGTNLELTYGENEYVNYEPDRYTVGHWSLEEVAGNGAYIKDSSGNNLNGTPTGTAYAGGRIGNARSFNGSSSISLGNPAALQMTGNQTIEMWLYPTDMTARRNPFAKAYGGEGTITQEMSGVLNYYYGTAGANGTPYQAIGSIQPVIPYTWNHIAVVRDLRNMTLTWYINGKMTNTIAATYASATASSLPAYIGTGYTNPYVGVIDEVRISNIPRSADEIRQSYEIGSRTHPIKVNFKANLLSGNLISSSGDYSFSIDERPYGANNYIEHLEVGEKIIVKENYNGVEYIAQGNIATRNKDTGAVTVSSWDSGSTFPSGGYTVNSTVFKWQKEYVDLRQNLADDVDDISRLTFRKTTDVGANFWIDDARLTSYGKTSSNTVTPADSYLYGSSDDNLVAYFPMDETSGQLVKNVAGTKNGIATGTTVGEGYNSNARVFNGSSDYLSLSYDSVFNPSVLTVASWIKTNSSATQSIVALPGCDFDQSPCAYTPYQLYIDGGYLKAQLYNNSSQTITLTSPTQVNTNNWHHVALSFGGGVAKLFIDGEVVASDSLSGTMSQVTNDRLFIGATWLYSTGVTRYFAGSIDEVRIYSRTLTADEILQQYDSRINYIQYDAMFSRWSNNTDQEIYLYGVGINYTPDGPTMDQVMRHGKWFSGGTKQPYWWAK